MNLIKIHNIDMLHFLWVIPVLIGFYIFAYEKRKKALHIFISSGLIDKIKISVSQTKRNIKTALLLTAIIFIIISMTRPAWNPKSEIIHRKGRDVVFLLDVSKSMLAEDLIPNRLERAKLAIKDCVEQLEGDRVGLVVFAGTSVVKCPLTLDYGFFRMMLNSIDTNSVSRGGTMIGDALRKILTEVFDDQQKEYKDIILITDGDDHDSFPVEASKKAGDKGIRLIAIGLGDESEGKRIPIKDEYGRKTYLKYQGKEVWSKLGADTLRKMVNVTRGGKYLNVSTGAIDLGKVYKELIASAEKKELKSGTIKRYEEKFQIFLVIALILLLLELITNERKKGIKNV